MTTDTNKDTSQETKLSPELLRGVSIWDGFNYWKEIYGRVVTEEEDAEYREAGGAPGFRLAKYFVEQGTDEHGHPRVSVRFEFIHYPNEKVAIAAVVAEDAAEAKKGT